MVQLSMELTPAEAAALQALCGRLSDARSRSIAATHPMSDLACAVAERMWFVLVEARQKATEQHYTAQAAEAARPCEICIGGAQPVACFACKAKAERGQE